MRKPLIPSIPHPWLLNCHGTTAITKSHPIHDILLTAVWINLRHVMLLFFRCMQILLYWIHKKCLSTTQFILSTNQWIVNTNVMCTRCTALWGGCLKISNLKNDVLLKNEWQLLLWETTGYFVGKVWVITYCQCI